MRLVWAEDVNTGICAPCSWRLCLCSSASVWWVPPEDRPTKEITKPTSRAGNDPVVNVACRVQRNEISVVYFQCLPALCWKTIDCHSLDL